ncbi:acyl-CoA thioesterase [Runella slithyformis]|uniref:Thioesterase superfamily protein n=1 Tax=Runella slithyformis (strain ATCC 29530 / DSM 19594 / LMG 11500 / NCIMB 11436 / LSU 4) TaxID=761193 RepID=A0A7U3ZNJ5_RUNSL|nr:thioesterase family protein [Runella slithyformis]AEI50447.1 thioesterase superfamily protein [Runella slithyformis DSM 19594]
MSSNAPYCHTIVVSENDIDELNHLNNAVYLHYVQEAATAHWQYAASDALLEAVVWMVRRHEIDYLRQAVAGDTLLVKTWVGKYTAATWDRHYEIYREKDNVLLVKAMSVWVPLDRQTHRIKRIEGELLACFLGGER